jgi:hypothetical protein
MRHRHGAHLVAQALFEGINEVRHRRRGMEGMTPKESSDVRIGPKTIKIRDSNLKQIRRAIRKKLRLRLGALPSRRNGRAERRVSCPRVSDRGTAHILQKLICFTQQVVDGPFRDTLLLDRFDGGLGLTRRCSCLLGLHCSTGVWCRSIVRTLVRLLGGRARSRLVECSNGYDSDALTRWEWRGRWHVAPGLLGRWLVRHVWWS